MWRMVLCGVCVGGCNYTHWLPIPPTPQVPGHTLPGGAIRKIHNDAPFPPATPTPHTQARAHLPPLITPHLVHTPSPLQATSPPSDPAVLLQRRIKKYFKKRRYNAPGFYAGTVHHYSPTDQVWHIHYDDSDSEDLEWPELEEALVKGVAPPAPPREGPPRRCRTQVTHRSKRTRPSSTRSQSPSTSRTEKRHRTHPPQKQPRQGIG